MPIHSEARPNHKSPVFQARNACFLPTRYVCLVVQIGDQAGLCAGDAVSVSKTVETAVLVPTNTLSSGYVYTFDIDFNITMDNIGSIPITIKEYIDLCPPVLLRVHQPQR